jgi:cell division protein FtsI/penicillin-binding protein 2
MGALLFCGLAAIAMVTGWWTYYRGPALLERTDNARRAIADRYVQRGAILDRHSDPLAASTGSPGNLIREYLHPALGTITGYTHPVYGQAGLEASLDPYLRGLRGIPGLTIWWNHILYGQPPPGLDVRLSLDQELQTAADTLLAQRNGALVLLNAQNGEILAISSAPAFDPNQLDEIWSDLIKDPETPLFNRATLGRYPAGTALGPFMLTAAIREGELPEIPTGYPSLFESYSIDCAFDPVDSNMDTLISNGCPFSQVILGQFLGPQKVLDLYTDLGLYSPPALRMPTGSSSAPIEFNDLEGAYLGLNEIEVTPLQLAYASAILSNNGIRPAPRLAIAVSSPTAGWITLPTLTEPVQVFSSDDVNDAALGLQATNFPIWQIVAVVPNNQDKNITWYIAGTLPDWGGTPLALAVILESDDPITAESLGQDLLKTAIGN